MEGFSEDQVLLTEAALGGYSLLYLSYDGKLAGILTIGDPARPGTKEIIQQLHKLGVRNCVMITGDTEDTAAKIAKECGIDKWISQALQEDKVRFIEEEKKAGHIVVMLGDGIIVGVNSALMLLGLFGLITPRLAAILHNGTTVVICVKSMQTGRHL